MARTGGLKTATAYNPTAAIVPNKTVLATDASGKVIAAPVPVGVAATVAPTVAVVPSTTSTATPSPAAPIKTVVQQPLTVASPLAVVVPPTAVTLVADSGVAAGAVVSTSTLTHPNQGQNPNQTNLVAAVDPGVYSAHSDPYDSQPGNTTYPMVPESPVLTVNVPVTGTPTTTIYNDSDGIGLNGAPIDSTSINGGPGGLTLPGSDSSKMIFVLVTLFILYRMVK